MSDLELPESWSPSARDLVEDVIEQRPDLGGADWAALAAAAELITLADEHVAIAREAGLVAVGSTGQPVAHPSAVESRLARAAAAAILARLTVDRGSRSTEKARSAARTRWAGRAI